MLGGDGAAALPLLGMKVAILGANERWTSFVPVLSAAFDPADASRALDAVLLHVWFDGDHGITVRVYASGALVGEISLPGNDDDDGEVTSQNLDLLEKLQHLEIVTKAERTALLKHMADADALRAWTMEHGVEKVLGLPFTEPLPTDVSEEALLSLLPKGAKLIDGAALGPSSRRKPANAAANAAPSAGVTSERTTKTSWTPQEKQTLALHCSYWADVWSMNNFRLYNCYKKHLGAAERPDVDRLCDAVARGDSAAIQKSVESILARIWSAEDWDKVIRDRKLVDGDEGEWDAWRARLPH